MTIAGTSDIELRREAGANALAVIRDTDQDATKAGFSAVRRTGCWRRAWRRAIGPARIDVIDFIPVDDAGLDTMLEPFLDRGRITLRRRRAFGR